MSIILTCDSCGDAVCRYNTRGRTPSPCNVRGCGGSYRVRGETRGEPPLALMVDACAKMKAITMEMDSIDRMEQGVLPVTDSLADRAERWMHSGGGRHIMRDLYALAAKLERRWRYTGIPISIAKVWEDERQAIKEVSAWCQRRGKPIAKDYGYTLNNSYRAYAARHMMDRRPDWKGMFEVRELRASQ